jgi:HSP20 family protein
MADDSIRFLQSLFLPAAASATRAGWQPFADVYRTPDGWLVKFDLAGVRPEDTQVGVRGRELWVRGTRRDWCVDEGCRHYTMEIAYSEFERSVTLPIDLEHARLSTEHRHGMLLVRIQEA